MDRFQHGPLSGWKEDHRKTGAVSSQYDSRNDSRKIDPRKNNHKKAREKTAEFTLIKTFCLFDGLWQESAANARLNRQSSHSFAIHSQRLKKSCTKSSKQASKQTTYPTKQQNPYKITKDRKENDRRKKKTKTKGGIGVFKFRPGRVKGGENDWLIAVILLTAL